MNATPKAETIRIGERDVPLRDCWCTPAWLVRRLHSRWDFGLDAAATLESAIVGPWFGPDHPVEDCRDALATPGPWVDYSGGKAVFCTPPQRTEPVDL